MHLRVLICALISWAVGAPAFANCAKVYGPAAFGSDITALHKALQANARDTLKTAGARLAAGLPCTTVVPPVPALATAYRYIGVHHAISGNSDQAGRFFRTALELDPNFEWGVNDLASDKKVLALYEASKAAAVGEPAAVPGKAFSVSDGNQVYIDGRPAKEVAATLNRPHLVQVVSNYKASASYLVDGNGFPAEILGEATVAVSQASGGKGPVRVQRLRPPAKTPLLVVGGVGMVAGAGLYAASFATRSSFDSAKNTQELMKHKSTTNALVIASGAAVLVGVGTGYAGFMLDGRPGFVYQLSY